MLAAHDVAAALRILHERIVDLMLVDIRLGDIDGLTFYKRLQGDGSDVPVIFISGHATLTEAAQAVKLGGFRFSGEAFHAPRKLAVSVRRCLEYTVLQRRLRAARSAQPGAAHRRRLSRHPKTRGRYASRRGDQCQCADHR